MVATALRMGRVIEEMPQVLKQFVTKQWEQAPRRQQLGLTSGVISAVKSAATSLDVWPWPRRCFVRSPTLHQATAARAGQTPGAGSEPSRAATHPPPRWQQLPSRLADACFLAARPPPQGGSPPGHLSNYPPQRKINFRILNKSFLSR